MRLAITFVGNPMPSNFEAINDRREIVALKREN
jgi:hypothetical protein